MTVFGGALRIWIYRWYLKLWQSGSTEQDHRWHAHLFNPFCFLLSWPSLSSTSSKCLSLIFMSVFGEALTIWVNGGRSLVTLCTFLHLGMITVFINLIFIGLIFFQSCSKLNVTQCSGWWCSSTAHVQKLQPWWWRTHSKLTICASRVQYEKLHWTHVQSGWWRTPSKLTIRCLDWN